MEITNDENKSSFMEWKIIGKIYYIYYYNNDHKFRNVFFSFIN